MSDEIIKYLKKNGYIDPQMQDENLWVAIMPFMWTYGIIRGTTLGYQTGYDERWCFNSLHEAQRALQFWKDNGFNGEPQRWHRHIPSGRRREGGKEWINL